MIAQEHHLFNHPSLMRKAVASSTKPCTPRRGNIPTRQTGCRHRASLGVCYSAPQRWQSLPPHHTVTSRRPGDMEGGSGSSPLVSTAGWAVAAMLVFNIIRSLVLMWVSGQRRNTPLAAARRRPARGDRRTSAEPSETSRTSSAPSSLTEATAVEQEGAEAGVTAGSGAAALVEGVAVEGAEEGMRGEGGQGPAVGADKGDVYGRVEASKGRGAPTVVRTTLESSTSAVPVEVEEAAAEGDVSPEEVTRYQLRPRGCQFNDNLGRVVFCATLEPAPEPESKFSSGSNPTLESGTGGRRSSRASPRPAWATVEWQQRFWEPLLCKYAQQPEDKVTGLLLLYGNSVLHILEGDNNQLFALLRELRAEDMKIHHLREIRVPCYILDLKERLFDEWLCAAVAQKPSPGSRGGLTRAAFKNPIAAAKAAAAAVAAAKAGTSDSLKRSTLPDNASASKISIGDSSQDPESESAASTPSPAALLIGRIQELELFVKFVGPKLSALGTSDRRLQALENLATFETTTPSEDMVKSLATDPVAPELQEFVTVYDADYHRYVSLMALVAEVEEEMEAAGGGDGRTRLAARAASLVEEIRHLARFYGDHLRRDLWESLAQDNEEHISNGADEVVKRLAQDMRLPVNDGATRTPA